MAVWSSFFGVGSSGCAFEMRIGLYGGTFDPIHHGHLILAREALEELGLDRVVFVPAAISPHKQDTPPTDGWLRLLMIERSILDEPGFEVDSCELCREPPSYTIRTIRSYRARFPEAELFYFVGEDNVPDLDTWKEIGEIKREAVIVVLGRGEGDAGGFRRISRVVDISSTDIRKRVAQERSVRYLLPEAACTVIEAQNLYRGSADE